MRIVITNIGDPYMIAKLPYTPLTKSGFLLREDVLLTRLYSQDIEALSYLYDKYAAALYGRIMVWVGDETKACGVLAKAFKEFWKEFSNQAIIQGSLFVWMLNITRRICFEGLE